MRCESVLRVCACLALKVPLHLSKILLLAPWCLILDPFQSVVLEVLPAKSRWSSAGFSDFEAHLDH